MRWSTFLLAAGLLCGAAVLGGRASAEYGKRPPLTFRPDNRAVGFGNVASAADTSLLWCTEGTDHFLVQDDAAVVIQQDLCSAVDRSAAIALATGGTPILACSDDAGSASECLVQWHDGADCRQRCGVGDIQLTAAGDDVIVGENAGDNALTVWAGNGGRARVAWKDSADAAYLENFGGIDQLTMSLGPGAGRQLVFGTLALTGYDYGHADEGDPLHVLAGPHAPDR
ncbi:MAG: hypothetical protein ABIL09_00775, partial [Gemmatimonadota bacterium]